MIIVAIPDHARNDHAYSYGGPVICILPCRALEKRGLKFRSGQLWWG
jgi:hypothetical protein